MRVMVAGATGILGSEIIEILEERDFPLSELRLVATDRSLGKDVEFRDVEIPVESELPDLRSVDLVFLCTPSAASLEIARAALHAETPCIDLSLAFSAAAEVPLLSPDLPSSQEALRQPVVRVPSGTGLAWALALAPLQEHAGLARVVGSCLQSAASAGREGVESLSRETISLLNQQELPEPTVFERTVAFDCIPRLSSADDEEADFEGTLTADVHRLLGSDFMLAASTAQVPTFIGEASWLAVETRRAVDWSQLASLLEKAPGLELSGTDPRGPSTRSVIGHDAVVVGRLRRDPSHDLGVLLWLLADPARLVASQAVRLAEARFCSH